MSEIRVATYTDIEALVVMARRMYEESPRYSAYRFDAQRVASVVAQLIAVPHADIFVAEKNGEIVGLLAAQITEMLWYSVTIAADQTLYVAPEHRNSWIAFRLIQAYETWARERGVQEINLGESAAIDSEQVGQLFERCGYRHSASTYTKQLGGGNVR